MVSFLDPPVLDPDPDPDPDLDLGPDAVILET
jgi:hypothetical protein